MGFLGTLFKSLKKTIAKVISSVVTVVGVGAASVTSAVTTTPSTSSQMNVKGYNESISAVTMCNLAAEASQGGLLNLYIRNMGIKNNNVKGWTHITEETCSSGFTYALWVNNYDPTVYTLVYSGTDQIKDVADYLPMELNENRSSQTRQAVDVYRNIDDTIASKRSSNPQKYGELSKLYICGHSLGGYLAMYVASDLVDSVIFSQANVLAKVSDNDYFKGSVSSINDISKRVQCVTFGAPGMHKKDTWKITLTSWQRQKVKNNNDKKYHDIITQYTNSDDPVATLLESELGHIGRKINLGKPNVSIWSKLDFIRNNRNLLAAASTLIYCHMPWVYINML